MNIKTEAVDERDEQEKALNKTVSSAWKLGSDQNGKNYYYNYVTGESSWKKVSSILKIIFFDFFSIFLMIQNI